MADPICRWRNPYFKTVREFINVLPKELLPSKEGREFTNNNFGAEFFGTPYQLACQLGLYYEDGENFIPRFVHNPSPSEIHDYLKNWINNYYVPNPYTKKGFDNIEPMVIHSELCRLLFTNKTDLNWNEVKDIIFKEVIGNDDILINSINAYSVVIQINSGHLKLKNDILYEDLPPYFIELEGTERNDKKFFFNFLEKNFSSLKPTTSEIKKTEQIIYYGAPGTGKSHKVNEILKKLNLQFYERITFHPEFDNASFVGGYRPVSKNVEHFYDDGDTYIEHEVHYEYVPQAFSNIYVKAWNDLDNQYYLAIEEINRGNCAEIFGDIFQLLDRNSNYTVSPSNELKEHLNKALINKDGINNGLKLPPNLSILATMNTSDQSLFPMDSAFKRRWDWEYIPICYDDILENESFGYSVIIDETHSFNWIDFIKNVNAKIKSNPNLGMDKCIGNYFIKSETNKISLKDFINKAVFYLWNDVFKDEDSSDSIFEKGISYEDFFPINTNGKEKVEKMLIDLNIDIIKKVKI